MSEPDDLLDSSYYRPLFQLLAGMDRDIAELYTERGHRGVSTRFVGPLIELSRTGPMSVRELATVREVTHSAMSQTVAAMTRAGLVMTERGEDARTRMVSLAPPAAELVPLLQAEWRATEAAVRELDRELPLGLMAVVDQVAAALERRSFRDRLRDHLDPAVRESSR